MPHLHWPEWRSGRICFLERQLFSRHAVDYQLASVIRDVLQPLKLTGSTLFAVDKVGNSNHSLKLALYFRGTLTDIHGLAHCNERGRARADVGRVDNGDNLRRRDVHRGAMWPGERDEGQNRWENRRHILLPLGAFMRMTAGINFCEAVARRATRSKSKRFALGAIVLAGRPRRHRGNPLNNSVAC